MIRYVSFLAAGVVVVYVAWIAALWWFQERVVFQPPSKIPASAVPARQVRYRAPDGIELFAYIVGDCSAATPIILAFHGNADIARWLVPWATAAAHETHACVMLPEYRGYDGLPERPSYATSRLDAQAALEYARSALGASAANTVYFGHSLGTAIAAELAAAATPRALVLQSPFSSARAMAKRMVVPGLTTFWGIISRVHFDTLDRVRALACPVWVAHGDADAVVPAEMGREVFNAAAHKGELLIVVGAAHSDVPTVGGAAYWDWFRGAVASSIKSPSDPGAGVGRSPAL